jgi:hypothetical protein
MVSSARAATVVALAVILVPAISQSGTAGTDVELTYRPWVIPSQPWINGDVLPAGGRHPGHKPHVPPPRRWRDALCAPADQKGPEKSALT